MHIARLDAVTFRNFEQSSFFFSPEFNFIYGENAQGKTNLLEAVYLFGGGKSFRVRRERDVIQFGQTQAHLQARVYTQGREQRLDAFFYTHKRRLLQANGVALQSPREMVGRLPGIFFGPEELQIIRAGGSLRRRFLDVALCQLRPRYLAALSAYNRVYAHKLSLLKSNADKQTLWVYNQKLAELSCVLIPMRAWLLSLLTPLASQLHRDMAGGREAILLRYVTQAGTDPLALTQTEMNERFCRLLEDKKEAEAASQRLLIGPHRDDFDTLLENRHVKDFGSQGQTRTAALALHLALREIFKEELGAYPLLLLDDVLSELDAGRQDYIVNHLTEGQILLTCCDDRGLARVKIGNTIHMKEGRGV